VTSARTMFAVFAASLADRLVSVTVWFRLLRRLLCCCTVAFRSEVFSTKLLALMLLRFNTVVLVTVRDSGGGLGGGAGDGGGGGTGEHTASLPNCEALP